MEYFHLTLNNLTINDILPLTDEKCKLVLSEEVKTRIKKCREYLDNKMKYQTEPIYGITTGFGSLCNVKIDTDQLSKLQKNLVMSHACGMGEEVPQEIVRLMMFLKIKSLGYGYSGVRMETVDRLVEMFNQNVYPVV